MPGVRSRAVPAQDLSIEIHDLDAGTVVETHRHDEERVGVVTKGSVLMVIAGDQRILTAGDTYRIPASAAHGARVLEAAAQVIEMWVGAPSLAVGPA